MSRNKIRMKATLIPKASQCIECQKYMNKTKECETNCEFEMEVQVKEILSNNTMLICYARTHEAVPASRLKNFRKE